jgi:hypothetical protein
MRGSKIDVYGNAPKQTGLFTDKSSFSKYFPPVYRDLEGFKKTLSEIEFKGGLDFEFPPSYKATVIGIASYDSCAAVPASPKLVNEVVSTLRGKKAKFVGHSVIGAEKECIKVTTGIDVTLDEFDDSMLKHYLLNADLAKAPDKSEKDDAGALGFMNLWTSTSLTLDVPNWKYCRGRDCEQVICPSHDVWGYCAIDAWSSLASDKVYDTQFKTFKVPDRLYTDLKELTYIAQQMQSNGIRVDMPYVDKLERESKAYKEKLFSDKRQFNPNASHQVTSWFAGKGVKLEANTKKDIQKAFEKTGEKYSYVMHDDGGKFTTENVANAEDLPEVLDALYRLYEYKDTGKGLDPWFAKKYRDHLDFIHPRFITIGASTTRWSSSKPNFTNIPARGFGRLVRAAIVPRDESLDLLHSDSSNLELRGVIYMAGYDPTKIIPGDPFKKLVSDSEGAFDRMADLTSSSTRQIAKTVSHASSYLEGIKLIDPREVNSPHIKRQIAAGALRVFKDWMYCGKYVAFTGANLSERLFGDKTFEHRKHALAIQHDIYFKQLPMIPQWHRKVLREIEETGMVRYPTGHFLRLYGSPEDNAKMGTAALGQGLGASYLQGIILRYSRELGEIPILFVHDSLDFEIPRGWGDQKAKDFIALMGEETPGLPGFKTPYKAFRGQNGLEFDEGDPDTHIPGVMKVLVK